MQIKGKNYTAEELQKIADNCYDRTAFVMALGWTYYNGPLSKKVDEIVKEMGISIAHFDASKKTKARRKYPVVKKNCPVCGKEFETQQGHPRETETCSYACSNVYFADSRHTEASKQKTSEALIAYYGKHPQLPRVKIDGKSYIEWIKECPICKSSFKTLKEDQVCCSSKCASILRVQDPEYIAKLRASALQRVANGTHNGWSSRTKLTPSFPEKIVIEILEELGYQLGRELKVGKWFIDFADIDRKIAIEIDGRQHKLPDRKASDANKDAYLISQGWQVNRVEWKKLTKESREELKVKIQGILSGFGV